MIFLPILKGHSRLRFSGIAPCITPQDLWNPSFSLGIAMIFLPILRAILGSDSAGARRAPPPRTSGILHFPKEFQ